MVITKRLDDRDLEGLPGIGPATKTQLNKIGINRISDKVTERNNNQMDEILKTREPNIDSWSNLAKNIPTRNDNFLQHLDLSNLNEMYFENNLA